jgi:uncharacterized protein DUF1566
MSGFPPSLRNPSVLWSLALGLVLIGTLADIAGAEEMSCLPKPPYEAPEYIAPTLKLPPAKVNLIDNGDGTITDLGRGLMWSQKDSYADLNKCLTWTESLKYVENLKMAKHIDWRIPTIKELATLFDNTQENVMAWDHHPQYPLALDKKFAEGEKRVLFHDPLN